MLLTIDCGSTLRSNDETPPRVPAGPARRPLSSTSVRLAPRPRRSIVCAPGPPFVTKFDEIAEVIWVEPAATGELCSIEATSDLPSRIEISGSMIEIGSGLLNGVTARMREPVTTTSPSAGARAVVGASGSSAGVS